MNKLSLFSILLFLLVSCKKEKKENISNEIIFEGITMTDEYNVVMSQDSTDWKFTDSWTDKEKSLFNENKNKYCDIEDYLIRAYPNPCDGMFYLHIPKPNDCKVAFRIVDKDFNILVSSDSITSNSIALTLKDYNKSNEIVRIYYKYLWENCELKGHGDIKIE